MIQLRLDIAKEITEQLDALKTRMWAADRLTQYQDAARTKEELDRLIEEAEDAKPD